MSFTCVTQIMRHCRTIYLAYPIWNAVRTELSWTHYLREDDPTPTRPAAIRGACAPLPGEGARESCVLVPPPGKGEVRWGSILRSRIWAMLETSKICRSWGMSEWNRRDPTPTLLLPGEGVREWCVLVPPPGKGEVRWGSILRSRIWAMLEIRKSAYGQALGVNA